MQNILSYKIINDSINCFYCMMGVTNIWGVRLHVCLGHLDSVGSQHWKDADSSGSEASNGKHEDEVDAKTGQVHFLVGGEV